MKHPSNNTITLYRKNNNGIPNFWRITKISDENENTIITKNGVVDSTKYNKNEIKSTKESIDTEYNRKIKDKLRQGYLKLEDVVDDNYLPNNQNLYQFLKTYLPENRSDANNVSLVMLAKVYNKNIAFKNTDKFLCSYKINGLRCTISVEKSTNDLFKKYKLIFRSRENIVWNSLTRLEDVLLKSIPDKLLNYLLENNCSLDGELYIHGLPVNEINSAVKNIDNSNNDKLQFWCYDLKIDTLNAYTRQLELAINSGLYDSLIYNYTDINYVNKSIVVNDGFIILRQYIVDNHIDIVTIRNKAIETGFEGIVLRDYEKEYQFGKRNSAMLKYKSATDGIFQIIDIIPEGDKRENIPLLVLKNDINNETFKTKFSMSLNEQKTILINKHDYIGLNVFLEYGERSGVTKVPFHIKSVVLHKDKI